MDPHQDLHQCYDCKLWFPKDDLDGMDEDGNMSHASGKPALEPICIFCDSPNADNSHATPGIRKGEFTVRYTDGSETRHPYLHLAQQDVLETVTGCDFAVGVESITDDQGTEYGCTWSVMVEIL